MKRYLIHLWLASILLATFHMGWQNDSGSQRNLNPECIDKVVRNHEVVISKALDVDKKGGLDEVVLYKNDRLYILIALSPSSANCDIILNEHLTNLALVTGQQTIEVREIEMIELTGDEQPELYVWIDKKGGGRFVSAATHTIYGSGNGRWQKELHIEQCLGFSSFEFREISLNGNIDIYRDTDVTCVTPFSQERNYEIRRWDGSEFATIETGTISKFSLYPPIWYAICVLALFCPTVLFSIFAVISIRAKRTSGQANPV